MNKKLAKIDSLRESISSLSYDTKEMKKMRREINKFSADIKGRKISVSFGSGGWPPPEMGRFVKGAEVDTHMCASDSLQEVVDRAVKASARSAKRSLGLSIKEADDQKSKLERDLRKVLA